MGNKLHEALGFENSQSFPKRGSADADLLAKLGFDDPLPAD